MNAIARAAITCCVSAFGLSGAAWAAPCDPAGNVTPEVYYGLFYDCAIARAGKPDSQNLREWIDAAVEICRAHGARDMRTTVRSCAGRCLYALTPEGMAPQQAAPPRPAPSAAADPCDLFAARDRVNQEMPGADPETKVAVLQYFLEARGCFAPRH